jgi:hypothetical protein
MVDLGNNAYFDIQTSEACDVVLERHPLIGFLTKSYETVQGEVVIEAWPVSTVGENVTPNFIQRHDGTFTDTQGERTCYSIIDMMYERGFEPDNSIALPPRIRKSYRNSFGAHFVTRMSNCTASIC